MSVEADSQTRCFWIASATCSTCWGGIPHITGVMLQKWGAEAGAGTEGKPNWNPSSATYQLPVSERGISPATALCRALEDWSRARRSQRGHKGTLADLLWVSLPLTQPPSLTWPLGTRTASQEGPKNTSLLCSGPTPTPAAAPIHADSRTIINY